MKIVADENIPWVREYFGALPNTELVLKPGRTLQREDVRDADCLIIRSVTKVDKNLLANTTVKFVGSVVAGLDHLDTEWLEQAGIRWYAAQGCNATAVSEYVVSVVAALDATGILSAKNSRAGVVGVGRVGSQVVEKLRLLGFSVMECDPLRAEREKDFMSLSLEKFSDLDFITLHTPLTKQGAYPTYHMIEEHFLQQQKNQSILLNTGRGSVVDFAALAEVGKSLYWCLDVWENEPRIAENILQSALIATPHIAGHSLQAKQRGLEMIYHAMCQQNIISPKQKVSVAYPTLTISFQNKKVDWREVILKIYDPRNTMAQWKKSLGANANAFDELRNNFNERHEFAYITIQDALLSDEDELLLKQLGLKIV